MTPPAPPINALSALSPSDTALAPVLPADAPFDDGQRQWLNGLLTGLTVLARAANNNTATKTDAPTVPLTILYGSQSGNCEALSKNLRKHAAAAGFAPAVKELNDLDPAELPALGRVLILCSTFGEGDPPDNALNFCKKIHADDAPDLAGLTFSVCGLGDSSYTHFNKTGRDLDTRRAELGATRAADFLPCDIDFEDDFAQWKTNVFATDAFKIEGAVTPESPEQNDQTPAEKYTKAHPFSATILEIKNLSGENSAKEVNHVELSLVGSGLDYQAGDALGVWPTNCSQLVNEVLAATGFTGREVVTLKAGPMPLRAALLNKLDLVTVTAKTLEVLGIDQTPEDTADTHLVDLLETFQPDIQPQQLAEAQRPLQPRLYSIASSPNAHPGEVHLTVGAVRYKTQGKQRQGVASVFLADRCRVGTSVRVYLQRSAHFHLPDDDVPLIMIGPGTGIAPFRAFLQERATHPNPGRNWLFFGDQHEQSDFLYRKEIQHWLANGTLEHFSAAWSRDQTEKIYVQTLMKKHGQELWQWLEQGAAFYLCGDASRMAKDADAALHQLIREHGHMSPDAADAYVQQLKTDRRYQRDVY